MEYAVFIPINLSKSCVYAKLSETISLLARWWAARAGKGPGVWEVTKRVGTGGMEGDGM